MPLTVFGNRAYRDAWNQVRGMPSAAAAHAYVEIVTRLAPDWEAQDPPAGGSGDSGGGGDAEAKSMGPVQSTLYVVEDTVADSDKTAFNYVEDGDLNGLTQALATETAQGNSGALVAQTDDSVLYRCFTSTRLTGLIQKLRRVVRALCQGMTLLHWASDRGHVEICRYLIDNAADVNAVVSLRTCANVSGRSSPYVVGAFAGCGVNVTAALWYVH